MSKLVECIPNFSCSKEKDEAAYNALVEVANSVPGCTLFDAQTDGNHNRCVFTMIGSPEAIEEVAFQLTKKASEVIDMTKHQGQHPRMGAVDVVPFIPVRGCTIEEADTVAKSVAKRMGEELGIPCFLYEKSASAPHRANLADIRKGQFEGMPEKMEKTEWKPDFGPEHIHPTAGVSAVGARMPLVAFNINLDTNNLDIATAIAKKVRYINGGFRFVKAMGVTLEERHIVQVSMNLTDFTRTAVYRVFETVKMEARRYGVNVVGSEVIGLVPMQALIDCAEYYLQIENFSSDQILESRL